MMIMMADYNGLQTGTTVRCKTCYGREIVGEVAAFDLTLKSLILSCPPSNATGATSGRCDVHMLNINRLSELTVLKEAQSEEASLPALDNNKLTNRVKDNVQKKLSRVQSIGVGVSPEGQELFNTIKKTIEDIHWDGKTIVVMNDLDIVEPYGENDLKTRKGGSSKTQDHILKIVQKHYADKLK